MFACHGKKFFTCYKENVHFFVFVLGIGDFIAVALGFLRANVWWVAFWMLLGKALRYWVWMELVYKVQGAV